MLGALPNTHSERTVPLTMAVTASDRIRRSAHTTVSRASRELVEEGGAGGPVMEGHGVWSCGWKVQRTKTASLAKGKPCLKRDV